MPHEYIPSCGVRGRDPGLKQTLQTTNEWLQCVGLPQFPTPQARMLSLHPYVTGNQSLVLDPCFKQGQRSEEKGVHKSSLVSACCDIWELPKMCRKIPCFKKCKRAWLWSLDGIKRSMASFLPDQRQPLKRWRLICLLAYISCFASCGNAEQKTLLSPHTHFNMFSVPCCTEGTPCHHKVTSSLYFFNCMYYD